MPLFRIIRQKLLQKNNIGKYLLYALGEILLVVVGILIALQIDNQNKIRQDEEEELKILTSLRGALKTNLEEFKINYESQQQRYAGVWTFMNINTEIDKYSLSELDSLLGLTANSFTYNPSFGIYNAIVSSGKIELISNDSLKNEVSKFKDLIADYQEEEVEVVDFTNQYLHANFIEYYAIDPAILVPIRRRTEEEEVADWKFYERTLKSNRIRNIYFLLLFSMQDIINEGQIIEKELEKLIALVEEEIQE